jgi:Ca-activated chloride channel family protein
MDAGNNRVILATDGDFNVGANSDQAMEDLIKEKRKSGVFLTCLGFGMGNYQDSKMEKLADQGNGNHSYIDNMQEAQRVLGTEFGGTLYTIAKDVKIQVEFNPAKVAGYRLIGYENRMLDAEDFNDDKKDAGELGSGHKVTALYEIIPPSVKSKYLKDIDNLKYSERKKTADSDELLTVKFRYKKPDGDKSKLIVTSLKAKKAPVMQQANADFQFASAVALFGMKLKETEYAENLKTKKIIELAEAGRGSDKDGYRAEFIRLVKSME